MDIFILILYFYLNGVLAMHVFEGEKPANFREWFTFSFLSILGVIFLIVAIAYYYIKKLLKI